MNSQSKPAASKSKAQSPNPAAPGYGGLARIGAATRNSIRGIRHGVATEAAIKQEFAVIVLAVPISIIVAESVWIWLALMGSLMFMLSVEYVNTAIEKLCDHVTPDRHEDIKVVKDLASAGVLFSLLLAALIWIIAIMERIVLMVV